MKFKWQLNSDTIQVMVLAPRGAAASSSSSARPCLEICVAQHRMIYMCVALLTCVNFNELAFIIYHVSPKYPFPKSLISPPSFLCVVLLCFLGKLWSPFLWRDKAALNLLKANRFHWKCVRLVHVAFLRSYFAASRQCQTLSRHRRIRKSRTASLEPRH